MQSVFSTGGVAGSHKTNLYYHWLRASYKSIDHTYPQWVSPECDVSSVFWRQTVTAPLPKGRTSKPINNSPCNIMISQAHIKYELGWKTEPKRVQLLHVPLHAAGFIKRSMWGEIKASVLGGISPCSRTAWTWLPVSLNTVQMHGWGRISPQTSDPRSCRLSTHRWNFLLYLFFFFTSILVKWYIQRLKHAFDRDEELIYGRTFITTHS